MPTYAPTYYARHTPALDLEDVEDDTIARLWAERRIAVHYPEQRDGTLGPEDNPSTDPDDHALNTHAHPVMRALRALADGGGYVCAQYRGCEACPVGRVAPHTPIEPLPVTWRHAWKAERLREYRDTSVHSTNLHRTDVRDPHVPGAHAHESSDGRAVAGAALDPHLVLSCDTWADDVVALPGGVTAVSIGGVYARVGASAWGAT